MHCVLCNCVLKFRHCISRCRSGRPPVTGADFGAKVKGPKLQPTWGGNSFHSGFTSGAGETPLANYDLAQDGMRSGTGAVAQQT